MRTMTPVNTCLVVIDYQEKLQKNMDAGSAAR